MPPLAGAAVKVKAAIVRLNIALPRKVDEKLEAMARSQGVSKTEVLRRAISTEWFLRRRIADGDKVLMERPDGTQQQIIFSYWGDED